MREVTLIRMGLAAFVLVGGAGVLLAAGCGSNSNGTTPPNDGGTDSTMGNPDMGSSPDTGTPDTVGPSDAGQDTGPVCVLPGPFDAGNNDSHLILVHASPDAPPLRICFAINGSVAPLAPLPKTVVGLPPGTGGGVPDLEDLSGYAVTGYAIPSPTLAAMSDGGVNTTSCPLLIGTDGSGTGSGGLLTLGRDYFNIGTFPAGTFAHSTTQLIAATGCLPGEDGGSGIPPQLRCGSNYDPDGGNLNALVFSVDRSVAAGMFGAQILHVAQALDGLESAEVTQPVTQVVAFATPSGDGGAPTAILPPISALPPPFGGTGIVFGQLQEPTATKYASTVAADTNIIGFQAYLQTADGGQIPGTGGGLPLSAVVELSTGAADTPSCPYFQGGENYTFVLLGDPSSGPFVAADGGINLYGVHVLAFPNNIHPPPTQ
jgi:hypothetical protein